MSTLTRRSKVTPFIKKNVLNEISRKSNLNHTTEVLRWELYNSYT